MTVRATVDDPVRWSQPPGYGYGGGVAPARERIGFGRTVLLLLSIGCVSQSAPPCVEGLELGERVVFQIVERFDETSPYMYVPDERGPGTLPPCDLAGAGLPDVEIDQRFEFRTDEIYFDNICVVYRCPNDLPTESIESLNGGRATIGYGGSLCHNGERDVDLGHGCIARRSTLLQSIAGVGSPRIEGRPPPTVFTRVLYREAGACDHIPALGGEGCIDTWVVDTLTPLD